MNLGMDFFKLIFSDANIETVANAVKLSVPDEYDFLVTLVSEIFQALNDIPDIKDSEDVVAECIDMGTEFLDGLDDLPIVRDLQEIERDDLIAAIASIIRFGIMAGQEGIQGVDFDTVTDFGAAMEAIALVSVRIAQISAEAKKAKIDIREKARESFRK